MKITSMDYGQFLLNSQQNFTGTYFADTVPDLDHNSVYRFLKNTKMTPKMVFEKTEQFLEASGDGYVLFDDTVADKDFSFNIEMVRKQYSGNAHGLVKGIGIVTCVYYQPKTKEFFALDFRIFDPDRDGKTKLDHVREMLDHLVAREVLFGHVLMDSWYAVTEFMMHIAKDLGKIFWCPVKANRLVHEGTALSVATNVEKLVWSDHDLAHGKNVHIKGFPSGFQMKLFRLVVSTDRTDYVVTNDLTQNSTDNARKECAIRWKIEEFHRELKQLTGIEKCQTRSRRSQRNHICIAILAWICLKQTARKNFVTIYEQKRKPLREFITAQWRNPSTKFC